jgi:septum formation topological specificity factor MinE
MDGWFFVLPLYEGQQTMPETLDTIDGLLDAYLLANDLEPTTEAWYRRIFSVFHEWHGRDSQRPELRAELLSTFLRDMREGHSTHYCKSLRNGLLAVLGKHVERCNVRTVKLKKLQPESWTQEDVELLVRCAFVLPARKHIYYSRVSLFAWHTGLSKGDLHLIERGHFEADGTLLFERHKTGESVVVWVPPHLLEGLPESGPLFPRLWSDEQFRKDFKRMVQAAGLTGTFKKLRKTSGTEAEILTGRGHEHLANSRKVFEVHYLDRKRVHREPVRLPQIG